MPAALSILLGMSGAAGVGCGSSDSNTELRPEGGPEILEIFLKERNADGDVVDGLAYVKEAEWLEEWSAELEALYGYPFAATSTTAVVFEEQMLRVVADELLDGRTLEMFVCACAYDEALDPGNCPGGVTEAIDPSACVDNPDTLAREQGRFLDLERNNIPPDGMPDMALLMAGSVTVDCGGGDTWSNPLGNGWYTPSGNQLVPTMGIDGIGPAIVVFPDVLPTSATCTVSLASSIRDKDGEGFATPASAPSFQTEALMVVDAVPPDGATGVAAAAVVVEVAFNTLVEAEAADLTVEDAGGTAVTGTFAVTDNVLSFTPDPALAFETTYTVTVTTGVTDTFGKALPAAFTFSFTTGAAPTP